MLTQEQITEAKRLIAEAVAGYSPERQPAFKLLASFRNEIIALRKRGAGFKSIATVLRAAKIIVSIATIARFCKTLPGLAQAKPKSDRPQSVTKPGKPGAKANAYPVRAATSQRSILGVLPDGPRIADPSTL